MRGEDGGQRGRGPPHALAAFSGFLPVRLFPEIEQFISKIIGGAGNKQLVAGLSVFVHRFLHFSPSVLYRTGEGRSEAHPNFY